MRPLGGNNDPTPLYYRLETIIRGAIESGEYSAGACLPSERDLAGVYGVSRITVRKAIASLVRDGLLRRTRGRRGGTFVLDQLKQRAVSTLGPLDRVATRAQVNRIEVLAFDFRRCEIQIAKILGVQQKEQVRYVERLISTPEGPLAHVRNFLPAALGEKLERKDLCGHFIKNMLVRSHGLKIDRVRDEVEAHLADSRVAALLKIRAGYPVLRVTRFFLEKNSRCLYLTLLLVSGKYRMAVTLPEALLG